MTTNDDQYAPDEEQVRAWCREGTGDYPDVMDEWLDRFLARVRRDALATAEHRAIRAEAQSDIRGRAVVMYRERAREAEAERDAARGYISDLETAVQSRNDVIKHRDARIKAVQDLIDQTEAGVKRLSWANGHAADKYATDMEELRQELAQADARIRAARAIHRDLYESMPGFPYCDSCDRDWPCPTIRALDGDA